MRRDPSTFTFQTLILTAIPTALLCKVKMIAKMNMMIMEVMAPPVEVMRVMIIMICYCCQWPFWVFHELGEVSPTWRLHRRDSGGAGQQQQERWNHIKWNECYGDPARYQHMSRQLFLDYIMKGSEVGSRNCMQFTARGIFDSFSSVMFEQWHKHKSDLLKKNQRKALLLNCRSTCLSPLAKNTLSPGSTTYTVKQPLKCHPVL